MHNVRVSYVVASTWAKSAPLSITVRGGTDPLSLPFVATRNSAIASSDGGHTATISTSAWTSRVRYVELSDVTPASVTHARFDSRRAAATQISMLQPVTS